MTVSVARLPATPAVGAHRVQIACGGCGRQRVVRVETASRIRNGKTTNRCEDCRRPVTRARERDLRWWLTRFGIRLERGQNAADYVQANGLPAELSELVASLSGSPWGD